ncbi:phosphoesterase [Sphingobacterium sp. CZ-UAM]|uniref:metallophosphoesterase n=1 Tax=Sphingobacterium sp. CZ-UAM TaxID=1933868 RepID=UPI000986E84B|nr:metallophosphoesterase [Sphingobacterium sp. CZ-UAM]OOG20069.1 phosphoesterase [Sphingobacterium sp. CZ-UAM]
MKKKRFFKKAFITLTLIAALLGYYAWQIEPHWVRFDQLKLPIKNLPEKLEGKTLVQISDIHIGDYVDKDFIINNFAKVGVMHADIIVYTGDFVRLVDNALPLDDLDAVLRLAPRGKLQTLAILGNHDYGRAFKDGAAADSITALLTKYCITVLRNESLQINGLHIYGMDDYWGTNFDPIKTMQNYSPKQASLVLCHNPDVADLDVWNGYEGWILSGHTHAGQVRLPFWGSPIIPVSNKNYDQGIKKVSGNRTLYINRGLGHSIPIRFNARPEIAIFTLTKG